MITTGSNKARRSAYATARTPWSATAGLMLAAGLALAAGACAADRPAGGNGLATITVLTPGYDEWLAALHVDDYGKLYFFEPLVRIRDGDPVPALARAWEHSPDYRHWTIHLRSDVRWHDGTPFTAHDVKFTIDLWSHPDVQWYGPEAFTNLTIIDDTTFTVTYDAPSRALLNAWGVFYPRHVLEALDPAEWQRWEFWTRPVGNGPWRYVRHVPKTMMELEANPDYYGGRPRIDRVVLKFGGSAVTELLGGGVDIAPIAGPDIARIQADERFRVQYRASPARDQIFWNNRDPRFADARVRRALTMAIDRRQIHQVIHYPPDSPLYDGLCTSRQFARGQCGPALPHDPEAAARLLDEAGWRDTDNDGVRERSGIRLAFTLVTPPGDEARAAVLVQDHLRRAGARVDVRTLEISAARDRLLAHDYQAVITRVPNSAGHHFQYFAGRNDPGWQNARAAALLDSVRFIMDPDEVDRVYVELAEIFRQEVPVTLLWSKTRFTALDRRIRGFEAAEALHELWIEEDT